MTLREATHVSTALAVSAALAVVLGASPAAAQRATASLIPVASGVVDNAGPWPPVDSEMCLRGSAYVLAFERGAGDGEGYATVKVGAPPDSREVAGMTLTPADQDGWAWVPF
ncbi:MAG: hypothetical protein F4Y94_00375, partial [Chloroflexi bacterium]|nr:hypothetical protein [Chloroflexota bacterium]